jgi:hypothetical protein
MGDGCFLGHNVGVKLLSPGCKWGNHSTGKQLCATLEDGHPARALTMGFTYCVTAFMPSLIHASSPD